MDKKCSYHDLHPHLFKRKEEKESPDRTKMLPPTQLWWKIIRGISGANPLIHPSIHGTEQLTQWQLRHQMLDLKQLVFRPRQAARGCGGLPQQLLLLQLLLKSPTLFGVFTSSLIYPLRRALSHRNFYTFRGIYSYWMDPTQVVPWSTPKKRLPYSYTHTRMHPLKKAKQ